MSEYDALLAKYKFEKYFLKLQKKLKNKRVLIYGSGALFKSIKEKYDLDKLNIIGISDKKYCPNQEGQKDLGYDIIPVGKIVANKPDCVLIATLNTFVIYQSLKNNILKGTKIKLLPLVDKPFFELLREVL